MERDNPEPQGKFELGQIVGTPGAVSAFKRTRQNPLEFIARHWTGGWGDLEEEDKDENEFSVERNLRILSTYHLSDGTRVWIITEADRSTTTLLLPEEY